jgi:DNA-binding transcriptional ArsR family regulator
MTDGPQIARVAAMIGDPGRANMLVALLDGRALTATELGHAAGVAAPTASGHLGKLVEARLLAMEKQGRRRYFRLAGPDVAQVLENLMGLAQSTGARPFRLGPREPALRAARVCYDHLAGEKAVALADACEARGLLRLGADSALTDSGQVFFAGLGFDLPRLAAARRPLCRACLDWSERRSHIAGGLGAAVLAHIFAAGWARRGEGRAVSFSPVGAAAFDRAFGLV